MMNSSRKLITISLLLTLIAPMLLFADQGISNLQHIEELQVVEEKQREIVVDVMNTSGAIVHMPLDVYLTSVILREMPAGFSHEALKAQAIVARTYTLRHAEDSDKHTEYDVCTNAGCCQGFRSEDDYIRSGGKTSDVKKVKMAVEETRNLVLTYNGALIDATYFSCSGGMTEDAVDVWGKDIPYLQSTVSKGEEGAVHYKDTVSYTAADLADMLSISVSGPPECWVEEITETEGGGVDIIRICGKKFKGTELRKLLNLRSTAFKISHDKGVFLIETRGFGHRVGLSQYGAEAMAKRGASYEQILLHYYKGVALVEYVPED